MSEEQITNGEVLNAAKAAWHDWHRSIWNEPGDDYVPEMSSLWRLAFTTGAKWAAGRKGEI